MSQLRTNVCVICWDKIFIIGALQACMCCGWEGCLNTSHQYHFSALPLTGIRVLSEEITVLNVLNCPSCIFMLVYHNGNRQNERGITKLTCNSNRQNDFDIISLSMTLPTYGITVWQLICIMDVLKQMQSLLIMSICLLKHDENHVMCLDFKRKFHPKIHF